MSEILTKEKFNNLLKQIGKERKHALESFYNAYASLIYISALSVCRTPSIADEVVNDVLVKVWKFTKSKTIYVENPEGWIYTITVNAAKNKIEKINFPLTENIIAPSNEVDSFISGDAFTSYIADLNDEEKQILICRFVQDMKFEDIAARFNIPLSSLTTKYYRTLKKVKATIEKKL